MLLTDLLHLCTSVFRPPPAPKAAERKLLIIPTHESVDKPSMAPILAKAVEQLVASGKLWRWISTDGKKPLCSWDSTQLLFVRGTVQDWQVYIGQHFVVRDSNGIEYAGPSALVADRLIAGVLAHPETLVASWQIQMDKRRAAARQKEGAK
jgi:hypothetical protein